MSRTPPLALVVTAAVGLLLALALQVALVSSGQPRYQPPAYLALPLVAIGVTVVLLAVPVWRAPRRPGGRIDPFYAIRVVLFAKASSLAGALFGGVAVGLMLFLLFRAVPSDSAVLPVFAVFGGAVLLVVGGLIAEQLCRLPPPPSADEVGGADDAADGVR